MIGTSFPRRRSARPQRETGRSTMESLRSGSFMGTGSFRCTHCGYMFTLDGSDSCRTAREWRRSLREGVDVQHRADRPPASRRPPARARWPCRPEQDAGLAEVARAHRSAGRLRRLRRRRRAAVVAADAEWTRIGRSLAADVRFDDPTVSRRHALIVRQPDGVRLLDDRSLNGVFVNGARVDGGRSATATRSSSAATACCSCRPAARATSAGAPRTGHPLHYVG